MGIQLLSVFRIQNGIVILILWLDQKDSPNMIGLLNARQDKPLSYYRDKTSSAEISVEALFTRSWRILLNFWVGIRRSLDGRLCGRRGVFSLDILFLRRLTSPAATA